MLTAQKDHPRIRGEHRPRGFRSAPGPGSSPHTRGALCRSLLTVSVSRIIPAYAGSTGRRSTGCCGCRDHPRIRGEHRLDIPWPQAMQGSSPHTRGAHLHPIDIGFQLRIIPAYAGSTRTSQDPCAANRDHPRIRGEHKTFSRIWNSTSGSSPHTRGAHPAASHHALEERIIPAYAGSTPGTPM